MLVGEPDAVDSESLLWNRGLAWRNARRAFEGAIMHPSRLATMLPSVREGVRGLLARLAPHAGGPGRQGQAVDLKAAFAVFSLATTGGAAYGVDFWPDDGPGSKAGSKAEGGRAGEGSRLLSACTQALDCFELSQATAYLPLQLMLPALRPLWLWLAERLPDAPQRRNMAARQAVADASRRLMQGWQAAAESAAANGHATATNGHATAANGRATAANGGKAEAGGFVEVGSGIAGSSFLARLLQDRSSGAAGGGKEAKEGEAGAAAMSDIQVISQVLTFLMASFDTISTTLANTAFLLATHPAAQDKVRAELAAVAEEELGSDEAAEKMPYLDACFKESMRLYPAAPMFWRDCNADVKLKNGMAIPAGTFVCCSNYNVHRDPDVFPQPESFVPERFLPDAAGALGATHPHAFLAFGSGARACVGQRLAWVVLRAALGSVLRSYRLELSTQQRLPFRHRTALTLVPADGVWVCLQPV
ncbi:hypothetical protein HYH03_002451 [Edaphochlamys debaryana]|uniref:Cytochrome P450 n=1 Tax=Edaphochlamys debaryana TaxID=47281 RepID=A0A835YKS1_9CHLO|nr:hypothetical protein HYH03_002451 [Edaphochlamys debaryana]|eukprot:KAG2499504.1 hypothetical protein HYH03_002451 [Edaphochlamys debaryana]